MRVLGHGLEHGVVVDVSSTVVRMRTRGMGVVVMVTIRCAVMRR